MGGKERRGEQGHVVMKRQRIADKNESQNETKSSNEEEGQGEICDDIMHEILLRIPVKDIARCKFVSKDWLRVISSKVFVKACLQKACDDSNLSHHKLLSIEREGSEVALWQVCLQHALSGMGLYNAEYLTHPTEFWEEESGKFQGTFVGSCRGLICIAGLAHRVVIWNPTLEKCQSLPYFGSGSSIFYGFGYDESTDDFKVVGIRNSGKMLVKIYSARTHSWKKLNEDDFEIKVDDDDDDDDYDFDGHGCFLNGKIHWATQKRICTIDLSNERFGVTKLPTCMEGYFDRSLHVVGEFLAFFGFRSYGHPSMYQTDLWMIERFGASKDIDWPLYNNRGVCHRRLCISPSEPIEPIPTPSHMTGNAINAFLLYAFDNPPNFSMYFGRFRSVVVYVESLIWPWQYMSVV